MTSDIQNPQPGKEVWKVLIQTLITILTAIGTVFGLQSCGIIIL